MSTQPNEAACVRLFCPIAMNDADDFFRFFRGDSQGFKSLTGSAVGTNQRFIIRSGKCRSSMIGTTALWAGSFSVRFIFHNGQLPLYFFRRLYPDT